MVQFDKIQSARITVVTLTFPIDSRVLGIETLAHQINRITIMNNHSKLLNPSPSTLQPQLFIQRVLSPRKSIIC